MRIISGKHKSRRINAPNNFPTRPTKDIAKEALFNIINNLYYFEDLTVIDLFAGLGLIESSSLVFVSLPPASLHPVSTSPELLQPDALL